ncbi:SDR family NAD(P)-dependent oxidoreductase [Streptomyces sioyaensis]|uniref:SDR family NAD(P)-dependent oxidoreductase n=1 Tax=Streptomyces sioyaensis TaxID=67364 RepID=UPI001F3F07CE|nr:SDR family NAD(P)-dependent oxidoreductase [Streptomyces sioyaensis]
MPELAEEVARLGPIVTSVVNNAGFGTFGPFHQEDPQRLREEISVDVAGVIDISRAFIEPLRTAGTGVLINIGTNSADGGSTRQPPGRSWQRRCGRLAGPRRRLRPFLGRGAALARQPPHGRHQRTAG